LKLYFSKITKTRYGGNRQNDNYAAKASNHHLKGITHCMIAADPENPTLNFPLTALIGSFLSFVYFLCLKTIINHFQIIKDFV